MSRDRENTGMFCWLFHGNRLGLAKHGETVPLAQIRSDSKVTNDAPLDAPTFSINHAERHEDFMYPKKDIFPAKDIFRKISLIQLICAITRSLIRTINGGLSGMYYFQNDWKVLRSEKHSISGTFYKRRYYPQLCSSVYLHYRPQKDYIRMTNAQNLTQPFHRLKHLQRFLN